MSNNPGTSLRATAFAVLVTALAARPAPAQVGHDPAHSPYRDLRASHQITFSGGYLAGGGGEAGAGPKQGPLAGLRYSLSLSGSLEMTAGVHGASLDRFLVDSGTVARQSVIIADAGFTLRITGPKTWRGWMPYVGASMGLATGSAVVQDSSGFAFGNPFQFGPRLGLRRYTGGSVGLWIEGWDPIWRLRYPANWQSGDPPRVTAGREWVHNPTLLVGLSFTLRT
ncbi:MAG TPA: hypothetical protein VJL31_04500 [Gemmatimonadales bacterium]|jgi:hypothetical protein|nr:hypothetical protein [Gemmatimonadales bacterium]